MAIEQTLSIIKPDATEKNIIGKVITELEDASLCVIAAKMMRLTKEEGEAFYAVHKERPFFNDLVKFITSGRVLVMALKGENAIGKYRQVMGATNPKDAAPGTIRAKYASSIERNIVHGSDAQETAKVEIAFFFKPDELS
ncbi:nucleoside-diphosphate kinase [Simkania negevensis]|uniref:Nucleoside diphosphate kinase n=1 Tax=Simkania negevensis TaxID=83561 RepID=A0ABS3AT01_9BACT|nr:nucleoside-diphosphate kinase [Simkania negevensis]